MICHGCNKIAINNENVNTISDLSIFVAELVAKTLGAKAVVVLCGTVLLDVGIVDSGPT